MSENLPLVTQLSLDASNPDILVSTLLRKAKIIATKLNAIEFLSWINNELDGYESFDLPEYRKWHGTVHAKSGYHGWKPCQFKTAKSREMFSYTPIGASIGSIEATIDNMRDNPGGTLSFNLNPKRKQQMLDGIPGAEDVMIELPTSANAEILHAVRNIILDWSIKLEQNDVLGENASFTKENRTNAQPLTESTVEEIKSKDIPQSIVITGGINHIGSVSDQANVSNTLTVNNVIDVEGVKKLVDQINLNLQQLPESVREDVKLIANRLEDQIMKPIEERNLNLIEAGLSMLKALCEDARGNLFVQGIMSTAVALLTR